jgi:DNA-binding transcriptional LysR family regulator
MSDSLTFRLLRYIKAAAETLNFIRAAEQVFVAQSSLSSQIGKFEDTVELLLFARLQNGLKLTSAGHIVATFAENTLKEWDQTLAMALAVQRNEVPPLRLGFTRRSIGATQLRSRRRHIPWPDWKCQRRT